MKDNPYMENYDIGVISGRMSLRNPQSKSLEILDNILSNIALEKPDNNGVLSHYAENIAKIHSLYPTFTDFEHKFISLAFALATGVGKTRLMGAFITYLYTNYAYKNYFVVAPNITIYDKLRQDLGDLNNEKYVFKGLDCFINSPTIYTEDDYRQKRLQESDIRIFVYNIDKFNSEGLNMRQSTEFLGESFIDKLGNLSDLVVIMDESHHYRAEESAAALSLLKPILALELTATPYVNAKNKKKDRTEKDKKSKDKKSQENFKNVVYEYRISKAIADGYTRTPYAMTRENMGHISFGEEEFDRLMLEDGIKWHEHIKEALAAYARVHNKRIVKPFALVVCKNTAHAEQILKFIQSDNFFDGKYRNKVIKIDSKQSKAQREANTELLLKVERADNPIEIVIHVNVLKEGWDVNNLYTIIPLRAASSKILREQLIGRGLRLPYGERVGDKEIDSVTLTAHDKFNEIIEEAKSGESIFNVQNIIKAEEIEKEKITVTQIRLDFETDADKKAKEDCKQAGIEENEKNISIVKAINKKIKEKTIEATRPNVAEKAEDEIAKESVYDLNRDEMFAGAYESNQDIFDSILPKLT
ncbi:MAG: DEAD/DEAH box helicase family protein [Selenomonadaceae bacterium]|nr:DEAD/DEAH box helicase family protein [Selenomonadaceae bacterium]MBO6305235.1 DEAD/DEAH box helicase family protein [Selenomonadaceae bacterium]